MSANHYHFNDQNQYGRSLRRHLQQAEESDHGLANDRDVMIAMRSGDGTDAAHYAEVASKYGFENNAEAKAAFEELDSAYSKTSGNVSVDNVRAARDQLFDKLRG